MVQILPKRSGDAKPLNPPNGSVFLKILQPLTSSRFPVSSLFQNIPPAAFGGAERDLRVEGLVGFRSSERRWSNISTQAINISLLPERKPPVDSVRRQSLLQVFTQSIFSQVRHLVDGSDPA